MRRTFLKAMVISMMLIGPAVAQSDRPPGNEGPVPLLRAVPTPGIPTLVLGSTLHTAPLLADSFHCLVVNVGNDPIVARAKIYDGTGTDVTGYSNCNEPIKPREKCVATVTTTYELAHCSIAVGGSKENVRAVLVGLSGGYTDPFPGPTQGEFIPPQSMVAEAR